MTAGDQAARILANGCRDGRVHRACILIGESLNGEGFRIAETVLAMAQLLGNALASWPPASLEARQALIDGVMKAVAASEALARQHGSAIEAGAYMPPDTLQ